MKFAKTLLLATTMIVHSLALVTPPAGFQQVGQTLEASEVDKYGSIVQLSDDGTRLVVAGDGVGSSISVYDISLENGSAVWEPRLEVSFGTKGRLSLSGDGKLLAVRRLDTVEVFDIDSAEVTAVDACQGDSQNVKLGMTPGSSTFGSAYWLLISCESHEQNQGKIDVLRLDNNQWRPFTTILGQHTRAKFGWGTGFNVNDDQGPVVAVASPFYDNKRGLVQVFSLSHDGSYTQQGGDISGLAPGDKFGFSIAMSTAGLPFLVVGAPDCLEQHGCVSVHGWNPAGQDWDQVGAVITGQEEEESFGRAVAISKGGARIAASSVRNNIVRLYEGDFSLPPLAVFEGSVASQWGFDVSLNDSGSMLVSGSIAKGSRSVQVFLDETYSTLSSSPSSVPSFGPSAAPSFQPSASPSSLWAAQPSTAPSAAPTNEGNDSRETPIIVAVLVGTSVVGAVAAFCYFKKRRKEGEKDSTSETAVVDKDPESQDEGATGSEAKDEENEGGRASEATEIEDVEGPASQDDGTS